MATVIRMPAVLASATEAAIQAWSVSEGQTIEVGEPLADIETEKAVVEYAAEVAGTVGRLIAQPGDNLAVGAPIAIILGPGETLEDVVSSEPEPDATAAPVTASSRPTTSPTESLVAEIPSENPSPTSNSTSNPTANPTAPVPQPFAPATSATGSTDVPLTGMRRAIARRLTESKTTVPHFYVTAHVRVDRLFALRAEVNESASRKISVNDFVIKAVAGALIDVPAANAIWGGDHIRRFGGVDLAVAVAVEGGLLTPVLRRVDATSITDISTAVAELADRARAGKLRQEELEGGSFSISNLGMYGVDEFSAILNPPQAGILAVSAAKQQPVVNDGQLAVGTVMAVTLSADHRVIDGAVAAEWMAAFVRRVEHPVSLLL